MSEYHSRGYTVRIPDVLDFSPDLRRVTRALEAILQKSVSAAIFWSDGEIIAPVHWDEHDIIAVQLVGEKEWFISTDPPSLCNPWRRAGETPPRMEHYRTCTVRPGDLIYLPRGTSHTVRSTGESIHVSIGFVPLTVRDAMVAVIDHLADLHRPLRESIAPRADAFAAGALDRAAVDRLRIGLEQAVRAAGPAFLTEALEHQAWRMTRELPKLPAGQASQPVTADSIVSQSPLAIARILMLPEILDFAQPGTHMLVHPGAEQCLRFIAETARFRVGDIPGEVDDDVRVALVTKLIGTGFLQPAQAGAQEIAAE